MARCAQNYGTAAAIRVEMMKLPTKAAKPSLQEQRDAL
jgi:hypothetical protein